MTFFNECGVNGEPPTNSGIKGYTPDFSIPWISEGGFGNAMLINNTIISTGNIYALDSDGNSIKEHPFFMGYASYSDGLIYSYNPNNNQILVLNPENWKVVHQSTYKLNDKYSSRMMAGGESRVVFSIFETYSFTGKTICVDAETGSVLWKMDIGDRWGSMKIFNGIVLTTIYKGDKYNGTDYYSAYNLSNGALIWEIPIPITFDLSMPEIIGNRLYFTASILTDGYHANVYCLEITTGKIIWHSEFSNTRITSKPMIKDGKIIVVDYHGKVFCLSLADGNVLWSSLKDSDGGMGLYNPTVGFLGNYIVAGGDGINILDMNGTPVWYYKTGGLIKSPILSNGTAVFASNDNYLFAVKKGKSLNSDTFISGGDFSMWNLIKYDEEYANLSVRIDIHNRNFNFTKGDYFNKVNIWVENNGSKYLALDEYFNLSHNGLTEIAFSWNFSVGEYKFEVEVLPLNYTDQNITNNHYNFSEYVRQEEPPKQEWGWDISPGLCILSTIWPICLIGLIPIVLILTVIYIISKIERKKKKRTKKIKNKSRKRLIVDREDA